jgi:HTH-type transcriptional regulator/antitoxin HigA
MKKIATKTEYNRAMARTEELIQKATAVGGFQNLPPEEVAEYGSLAAAASKYEKDILKLFPYTEKNDVVLQLEVEMFRRRMKQRDMADFLGISPSRLCGVLKGKALISMPMAKAIHSKLKIDGNLILEQA